MMSSGEIRRSYESAKYPKRQIQILADLNCCTQDDIKDVLVEEGISIPGYVAHAVKKAKPAPAESHRAVEKIVRIPPAKPPLSVLAAIDAYILETQKALEIQAAESKKQAEEIAEKENALRKLQMDFNRKQAQIRQTEKELNEQIEWRRSLK